MTANAFFCEEETIIKDFSVNLLNLVFFDEMGEFLSDLAGIEFHGTGRLEESQGLFQQITGLHIGIARIHTTLKETVDKASAEALRSLTFDT